MIDLLKESAFLTDSEIREYNLYLTEIHNSHRMFQDMLTRFIYLENKLEQGERELFEKEFKKLLDKGMI